MPILNPFNTDAFNLASLSAATNILPNNYGKLNQINLFPTKSVTTRQILVDEKNGTLNLLSSFPVGSPGQKADRGTRTVRSFNVPHIPYDDLILPQEYEGIRAFGTENSTDTLSGVLIDHLQTMRDKHAITLEWLRLGALKGEIRDGDGSTVIYNLFEEFLIKQKTIDFVLGTSTTDVKKKCLEVKRYIENNLLGETMQGDPLVFVDPDFYDAFTSHPVVVDAYDRYNNGEFLRNDMRSGFRFGGLEWREYNATVTNSVGVSFTFFASGYGTAFPQGTMNTFKTIVSPADFVETVNTPGQLIYAKQEMADFDRGVKVHTQSNVLPLCFRPAVLVEVMTSTGV